MWPSSDGLACGSMRLKRRKSMDEEDEQLLPREKLLRYGVTLLKDDELLALFLRTGTSGTPPNSLWAK